MDKKRIPKIIHQIWIGDQSQRPVNLMQTWVDMNPEWEYRLWTDDNLPEMICQDQFDKMKQLHGKADILRYEILYQYGGFYVDADSECILPLEDFLLDNDSFAGYENERVRGNLIANGYIASTKENDLMWILLSKIKKIPDINIKEPWQITGPQLVTDTVRQIDYKELTVYPSHYFIPRHYSGVEYKGDGKVFARQYWGSTFGYKNIPK
jgi:mannosyltransferase OCH1-like enzyme